MFGSSQIREERFWMLAFISLFFLLSIALITAWNCPTKGYESSIYQSTPLIFWISIIISVIAGVSIVVRSIANNNREKNCLWIIGIILILLCYIICLSLFIVRGYYMWNMSGDSASHIRWITEILSIGHIPTNLIYPITHIYISEISILTNLNLVLLHKIVPLIIGLISVLFMYVLAKTFFMNSSGSVLVLLISCCFPFGCYITFLPNAFANLFLPLVLFLTFKYLQSKELSWAFALTISIFLYPIFHIIPAVFIGLFFITICLANYLLNETEVLGKRNTGAIKPNFEYLRMVIPLLILIIWLTFWIQSFKVFQISVMDIYQTISFEQHESSGKALLDSISSAQGYGYNILEHVIKVESVLLILLFLALIAIFKLWYEKTERDTYKYLLLMCGPLITIIFFMSVLFLFNLVFSPLRLKFYVVMLTTFFSAYIILFFLNDTRTLGKHYIHRTWFKTFGIIFLLVIIFSVGLLNLYPSPYQLQQNQQSTQMEIIGWSFFFEYRNVNVPLTGLSLAPGRFTHLLLSMDESARQRLPLYTGNQRYPWHFGYDTQHSISSFYTQETDMIIIPLNRRYYVDVFPEMADIRLKPNDFERILYDPGVSYIYSNGEFDYMKIR